MADNELRDLLADLARFENGRVVVRELRSRISRPVPAVRAAIRRRAVEILPRRGGLGAWVARARVTATLRLTGRTAGITLRGSRKSIADKSDLRRIDAGAVRAPSWGRRGPGQWHSQTVRAGYFTDPAAETDQWVEAVDDALTDAAVVISRG